MTKQTHALWVFIEQRSGLIQPVGKELLSEARRLADTADRPVNVVAVLLGHEMHEAAQSLEAYGPDEILYVDDPRLEHYDVFPYADALTRLIKQYSPTIFLLGGSVIGRDLAPRLSMRLDTGLTADATHLALQEDADTLLLEATRPAFGGNLYATILCPNTLPQMATIRPGVFTEVHTPHTKAQMHVIQFEALEAPKVVFLERKVKQRSAQDIAKANVIFSIGRGAKASLNTAKQVADALGATVASSRALVDEGVMVKDQQVGQTGKTIRPNIYVALGISGAVQHTAGMDKAELIIGVNTDPNAPIFGVSNISIVADAHAVLEAMASQLNAIE